MYEDEILREVWRVQDALAAKYGYDWRKMMAHDRRIYASLHKNAPGRAKAGLLRRSRVQRTKLGVSLRGSRRTLVRRRGASGRAATH